MDESDLGALITMGTLGILIMAFSFLLFSKLGKYIVFGYAYGNGGQRNDRRAVAKFIGKYYLPAGLLFLVCAFTFVFGGKDLYLIILSIAMIAAAAVLLIFPAGYIKGSDRFILTAPPPSFDENTAEIVMAQNGTRYSKIARNGDSYAYTVFILAFEDKQFRYRWIPAPEYAGIANSIEIAKEQAREAINNFVPVPIITKNTLEIIWAEDKKRYAAVYGYSLGTYTYAVMNLSYNDYEDEYFWEPFCGPGLSLFDTQEKAATEAKRDLGLLQNENEKIS